MNTEARMHDVQVLVYGPGGFGREVAWLAEECCSERTRYTVVSFVDDDERNHGKRINDIPVTGWAEAVQRHPHAKTVVALGSPQVRERIVERIGCSSTVLVHPSVAHSRWLEIGEGTVICARTVLTTNIVLGRHVQINLSCTIGHDVVMGDYSTLAPGAHISGWVHMGARVYVGTGAVILPGTADAPLVIGDDAVIGAGAVVRASVAPRTTMVGVPAKPVARR